jgi:hypothetical protein
MAYTYSKIATYTVGSGGVPSVSFLNIPQTYTDLVIKVSARTVRAADEDGLYMVINGVNSNGSIDIESNGGSFSSVNSGSSYGFNWTTRVNGNTATANTFGNAEIYISNYTSQFTKSMSIDGVTENNGSTAYMNLVGASGIGNSDGVKSLTFVCNANFAQYTTFHLYGIKAEV